LGDVDILLRGEIGDLTPIMTEVARPLNGADLALLRAQPVSVRMGTTLKRLRDSHHRMAMLTADGETPANIARILGYSLSRVYVIQSDPAFRELVSHYREDKGREYVGFHAVAAQTTIDCLQEINHRLDEEPDKIPLNFLKDFVKDMADRTGHAPVAKSVNVNVNANLAERLNRARARVDSQAQEGPA
jgi:hypothetical protein